MKVLYFTKYSRKGASSRLRSFQYFPFLEAEKIDITVQCLFSDNYLENLYSGKSNGIFKIVASYLRRLLMLLYVNKYDLLVIEKELFPYLPSWVEVLLYNLNVKYVVDYDDAIFHNYDLHSNFLVRKILGRKIDNVMKNASIVIAGNHYLAQRAIRAKAKSVHIIPTVIDLNRYKNKRQNNLDSDIIIGWIGTKSTFKYVKQLIPVFKELSKTYYYKIHLVGVDDNMGMPNIVNCIEWSENSEVEEISKFDIGIMPLSDTPWEKGKCSYKLIQYMACGIPVIASPIGMNLEVIEDNFNGFLADSEIQWKTSFRKYITDGALREKHGLEGRRIVESKYNLQIFQGNLAKILQG